MGSRGQKKHTQIHTYMHAHTHTDVQRQEEERRKWEAEVKRNINADLADRAIINPLAEKSSQIRIDPELAVRLKDHQVYG